MATTISLTEVGDSSEARPFKHQFRFREKCVLPPTPKPSDVAQGDPCFRVANGPDLCLWRRANNIRELRYLDELEAFGFHLWLLRFLIFYFL